MTSKWAHDPLPSKLKRELKRLDFHAPGERNARLQSATGARRSSPRRRDLESGTHARTRSSQLHTPSNSPDEPAGTAGRLPSSSRPPPKPPRPKRTSTQERTTQPRKEVSLETAGKPTEKVQPMAVKRKWPTQNRRRAATALYLYLVKQVQTGDEKYSKTDTEKTRMASFAAKVRWTYNGNENGNSDDLHKRHNEFFMAVTYQRLSGPGGGGTCTKRSKSSTAKTTYRSYVGTLEMHLWMSVIWPRNGRQGALGVNEYKKLFDDKCRAGARVPPRTLMSYKDEWIKHGFDMSLRRPGNPQTRKLSDLVEDFLLCCIISGVKRNDPLSAHDCIAFARNYVDGGGKGLRDMKLNATSMRTWFTLFKNRVYTKTGITIKKLQRVTQMSTARQTILFVDMARRPPQITLLSSNPVCTNIPTLLAVRAHIMPDLSNVVRNKARYGSCPYFDCAGHVSNAGDSDAQRQSRYKQSQSNRQLGRDLLRHK